MQPTGAGNSNVMWIPPSVQTSEGGAPSGPLGFSSGHETVQSMFSSTKCYDLIGASNKVSLYW